MSALQKMTDEELMASSRKKAEEIQALRAERIAISKEISFRGNAAQMLKALEMLKDMSPDDVKRLKALTQTIAPQGIESQEKVGNVGE